MATPEETLEKLQKALAPYIRPREEVAHIRRILALHLSSCVGEDAVSSPLALIEPAGAVDPPASARGLQREYLKALSANLKARREYEALRQGQAAVSKPATGASEDRQDEDLLAEHLVGIKLQKKQKKLEAIHKYLSLLEEKPAAAPDFLDPDDIFRDAKPLPEVPKTVLEGFGAPRESSSANLEDLTSQLEKQVLRAKLLLQREERLLQEVRAKSPARSNNISNAAKLHALNITRNELISWIEAELGKLPGNGVEEADEDEDGGAQLKTKEESGLNMDEELASIKEKYSQYMSLRTSLVQQASQQPQPALAPQSEASAEDTQVAPAPVVPSTYLISPYLEEFLAIAHEQKGLITHKSHLNMMIAKQLKDTCRNLDHLAEESHLLPAHPMPGSSRRKGFSDELAMAEKLDSVSRVKPWVFAADSAKIATFEVVAEKIEEGQLALEESSKSLAEIDLLMGRQPAAETAETAAEPSEDDIWLADEQAAGGKKGEVRRHIEKSTEKGSGDVWDILHGSLGLISRNEDA